LITLDLRELITELEIRTKMKRAPKCAVSTGLREVAIMPGSGTVVFEMPGISQRVTLLEGEVAEEIVISMKNFSGLLKWLKSFAGQETTVCMEASEAYIGFRCARSLCSFPRLKA